MRFRNKAFICQAGCRGLFGGDLFTGEFTFAPFFGVRHSDTQTELASRVSEKTSSASSPVEAGRELARAITDTACGGYGLPRSLSLKLATRIGDKFGFGAYARCVHPMVQSAMVLNELHTNDEPRALLKEICSTGSSLGLMVHELGAFLDLPMCETTAVEKDGSMFLQGKKQDLLDFNPKNFMVLAHSPDKRLSFYQIVAGTPGVKIQKVGAVTRLNMDGAKAQTILVDGIGHELYMATLFSCAPFVACAAAGAVKSALLRSKSGEAGTIELAPLAFATESTALAVSIILDRGTDDALVGSGILLALAHRCVEALQARPWLDPDTEGLLRAITVCDSIFSSLTTSSVGLEAFADRFNELTTLQLLQQRIGRVIGKNIVTTPPACPQSFAKVRSASADFADAVEAVAIRNGLSANMQHLHLVRITNAASLLLAAASAIGRADEAYHRKVPEASEMIELANSFTSLAIPEISWLNGCLTSTNVVADDSHYRVLSSLQHSTDQPKS